jgi:YHS domain-containing protein
MLRFVLELILILLVTRAFWRLIAAVVEGLTGRAAPSERTPVRGVQMVRDPVCGVYVVPDRALTITDGRRQIFFCSAACRDKYRATA